MDLNLQVDITEVIPHTLPELSLRDYVIRIKDIELRVTINDSLDDKRAEYNRLKQEVSDWKIFLKTEYDKYFKANYPEGSDDLYNGFWYGVWKIFSMNDLKRLSDLAEQIRNLEMALRYMKPERKYPVKPGSITDEDIEEAESISITSFIPGNFIRSTNRLKTKCPFHQEKTASFVIYKDNSWHCFGCNAHGRGAISFIMKLNNMNFKDAVKFLVNK